MILNRFEKLVKPWGTPVWKWCSHILKPKGLHTIQNLLWNNIWRNNPILCVSLCNSSKKVILMQTPHQDSNPRAKSNPRWSTVIVDQMLACSSTCFCLKPKVCELFPQSSLCYMLEKVYSHTFQQGLYFKKSQFEATFPQQKWQFCNSDPCCCTWTVTIFWGSCQKHWPMQLPWHVCKLRCTHTHISTKD